MKEDWWRISKSDEPSVEWTPQFGGLIRVEVLGERRMIGMYRMATCPKAKFAMGLAIPLIEEEMKNETR